MTEKPIEKLIVAVADLARAAPHQWGVFLAAFEQRNEDHRTHCVRATADVQIVQGMARESQAMLDLFKIAIQQADKLETIRRNKQTRL